MSFTARELLSSDTLRVPAGARPIDYQNEVGANPALSFAVFDGETLLGLVGSQAVRSGPERIFADLCHAVSSTPIPDSTPLEEILTEMDRQGTNALPVSDGQGRFQGIVTRTGINNFLLGQSERRQRETEVLAELARTINASLDLGTVLQRAAERAKDLCKSDIAKIALRDPASEAMVFRHLVGSRYQGYDSFRIEPGKGSGGQVLVTERPFRTDHYAEDPRISKDYLGAALEEGIVAELTVPIWIGDRVEGLLFVQNRTSRPFTDQDEVILLRLADHAAIAIQNARLYEETERRRRTAESLAEVGRLISQSLTPEQVGQQIADRVRALFGALASVLFQLEPDSGDLVALAVSGDVGPTFGRNLVSPKGTGLAGLAVRERHPMVTPDLLRDSRLAFSPETRARLEQTVHRAVLAVPLLVADSVIGALSIGDRAGRTFNDEEIRLAQAFADQAALALQNARLLQELRTRQARLEALLEGSRELSRIQPLESVLTSISRVCATLLGTDSVGFRLLEGDELVVMGTWGDAAEAMATPRLKIGESLSGRVAATGEPLVITDLLNDPRLLPAHREADRRLGHRAFLGVPIKVGEHLLGVLSIRTRRVEGFSAEDVAIATAFASQAALALENARLYQRAEERAEKLTALSTLTQRITSAKDSREVFNAVAEAATTLLGAKMARVWVDDPGARALRAQGNFSTEARFLPLMTSFSTLAYGTGVVSAAFESRAPAYIRDIQQDSRLINEELAKEADLHAFVGVPLITGNRVLGVLAILFGERPQFTSEEKELISLLADQAAIAIEQSRLFEEARRSYEELQQTQDQLVRSERLRALGEMAGGVAHDFNNALAVVLGRARLLLGQTQDPEVQRQVKVIENVAQDAARTVRRIQEFTRMRRARAFQPVDLNRVVEEVVEITRSRWKDEAQAKGISYDVRMEAAPLPAVAGDPSELREALTNLVLNALDAMPEGGRVTFQTELQGEDVICVVSDTGIGMTEEVRQRIFDPFFTTKARRGTGLGLSIVYGIITRHGGEIEVRSQVGQGSAFTLRLPVGRDIPEAPPSAHPAPSGRSGKILVIDDEPEVRQVLADLLAQQGHAVAACADGRSGLSRLREETFDLVITDLGMPGLSGWEVASQVKLRQPETPVALVTGWSDRIDPAAARAKGVDFLVAKPFKLEDVAAVVARALTPKGPGKG